MTTKTLFQLPILALPGGKSVHGSVVVTESLSLPSVYTLTFTSPPDNRLLTPFCQSVLLALDILEYSYPPGVLITTSGIQKFFSNGLDLEHATTTEGFYENSLFALFRRYLTYPMPTVALVNGHAFAGGFMVSMFNDYRIFNPSRGYLCLNELDLGVPLAPAMSSVFREKVSPPVYRDMVLEAKRYSGKLALEAGIVDGLGSMEEALAFIEDRGLTTKGKTGVYRALKQEMYRETLGALEGRAGRDIHADFKKELDKREERRTEDMRTRVEEWKRSTPSAKL